MAVKAKEKKTFGGFLNKVGWGVSSVTVYTIASGLLDSGAYKTVSSKLTHTHPSVTPRPQLSMYDDKEGIVLHEGPNPRVFMDVTIGGQPAGRIAMELYADTVPKTAEVIRVRVGFGCLVVWVFWGVGWLSGGDGGGLQFGRAKTRLIFLLVTNTTPKKLKRTHKNQPRTSARSARGRRASRPPPGRCSGTRARASTAASR